MGRNKDLVSELRGPQALQIDAIREAFAPLGFGDTRVQEFGSPQDVLLRFGNTANLQDAQRMIASRVAETLPGVANPAATLQDMSNFFEDRHMMGREEFLRILLKNQ